MLGDKHAMVAGTAAKNQTFDAEVVSAVLADEEMLLDVRAGRADEPDGHA